MALAKHAEEISEKVLENLQKLVQKENEKRCDPVPERFNQRDKMHHRPSGYLW